MALPGWPVLAGLLVGLAVVTARPPVLPGRARASSRRRWPVLVRVPRRSRVAEVDVAVLADRLAALSRAGVPLIRSWQLLAGRGDAEGRACRPVARAVALGGSSADGLLAASARSGPALRWLALTCEVSRGCGAPLADVLEGLARAVRAEADARRERELALAGPRATAALLTWLPAGGLLLGFLIGVNPLAVLLLSPAGWGCLLIGGLLWAAGRWWMRHLLRRAAGA